jgi:hypothetical protein
MLQMTMWLMFAKKKITVHGIKKARPLLEHVVTQMHALSRCT